MTVLRSAGSPFIGDFHGQRALELSPTRRWSSSWRHVAAEVLAKLRQADEAPAKGTPIAEEERSLRRPR